MGTPLVFTANLPVRPVGEMPDGHVQLHQDAYDCLAEIRTKVAGLSSANLSDATSFGSSLLAAMDAATARGLLGAGTSSLALGTTAATAKAGNYQPSAANISDSTTVGRSLLTAVDAPTARAAIGAGTSSLALGTTSTTAKAGDYAPTAASISDSTATGRALVTAVDAAAARTTLGTIASTDSRLSDARTPLAHTQTASTISDFTEAVQDAVAALLQAGTGVGVTYDDVNNTLTLTNTAGGGGGTTDPEVVRDTIGVALIGAGLITVTVNDVADSITITTTATANSTDAALRDRSTHTGSQLASTISDSTTVGRSVLTAADAATARTAIGAGTSSLALGSTGTTAAAGNHTHTASAISDSSTVGRAVLTAIDAATARTAIGAGTSSLVLGTTAGTAKDGAYQPAAANISDSTATGRSVLTAADAATARAAIGAGTSSLVLGTTTGTAKDGAYQPAAANISDSTAVGRAVLTAADANAARQATGAAPIATQEGLVAHDGTATGPARPSGYFRIRWVNPVGTTYGRPTNMVAGDVWEHSA